MGSKGQTRKHRRYELLIIYYFNDNHRGTGGRVSLFLSLWYLSVVAHLRRMRLAGYDCNVAKWHTKIALSRCYGSHILQTHCPVAITMLHVFPAPCTMIGSRLRRAEKETLPGLYLNIMPQNIQYIQREVLPLIAPKAFAAN